MIPEVLRKRCVNSVIRKTVPISDCTKKMMSNPYNNRPTQNCGKAIYPYSDVRIREQQLQWFIQSYDTVRDSATRNHVSTAISSTRWIPTTYRPLGVNRPAVAVATPTRQVRAAVIGWRGGQSAEVGVAWRRAPSISQSFGRYGWRVSVMFLLPRRGGQVPEWISRLCTAAVLGASIFFLFSFDCAAAAIDIA